MKRLLPFSLRSIGLSCFALAISFNASAQEDTAKKLESTGRSIMADPRLRNVLRNVKQDPEGALKEARKNPDDSVRDVLRDFQTKTKGIDAEELKEAASKAQSDGTIEKVINKASEAIKKETEDSATPEETATETKEADAKASEMKASEAKEGESKEAEPQDAATTVAKPMEEEPAAPLAIDVPATRPAPGIAGGTPTPIAMPVEPGASEESTMLVAQPTTIATPIDAPLPSAVAAAKDMVIGSEGVEPVAGTTPTTPMIPDSPLLKANDIPAPKPLTKKYAPGARAVYPSGDKKHMEIRAKESVMDNAEGLLIFTGDVEVDYPEFQIKCDKLEIYLAEGVGKEAGDSESNFKRAVASGGMVEIRRTAIEDGKSKTQIALGRRADYNGITKDMILSGGPPYIQDGDRFVKTNSEDSKIIMRGNGLYEITGSSQRVNIVIPVDASKDDKKKKPGSDVGGLGSTINRLR